MVNRQIHELKEGLPLNTLKELVDKNSWIVSSAPGRVDFLNTHQDYKGLSVVPASINLRSYVLGKVRKDRLFNITSLNLKMINEPYYDNFLLGLNYMKEKRWFGNYFRGVINTLVKKGYERRLRGMDVMVISEIPIGSGLGSSAALEVGFLKLLDYAFNLGLSNKELAELAYLSESKEVGIPCGRLDQYSSVYGGIIKLECKPPFNVKELGFKDLIFAVIDSGIRHATGEIHPMRQKEINEGLRILMDSDKVPYKLKLKLGYSYYEPYWEGIREEELMPYVTILNNKLANRLLYTIRANKLTEIGIRILEGGKIDIENLKNYLEPHIIKKIKHDSIPEFRKQLLGVIMNLQHELLRDLYDVSLPKLEDIRNVVLEKRGVYGIKISGAGLGGSLVALVKDCKTGKEIVKAAISAGAKQGWVSQVSSGAKIEHRNLQALLKHT